MDKAQKIKNLMNELKLGKNLSREDAVIMKPVSMDMILGYDEMNRQKSKFSDLTNSFRNLRSGDASREAVDRRQRKNH